MSSLGNVAVRDAFDDDKTPMHVIYAKGPASNTNNAKKFHYGTTHPKLLKDVQPYIDDIDEEVRSHRALGLVSYRDENCIDFAFYRAKIAREKAKKLAIQIAGEAGETDFHQLENRLNQYLYSTNRSYFCNYIIAKDKNTGEKLMDSKFDVYMTNQDFVMYFQLSFLPSADMPIIRYMFEHITKNPHPVGGEQFAWRSPLCLKAIASFFDTPLFADVCHLLMTPELKKNVTEKLVYAMDQFLAKRSAMKAEDDQTKYFFATSHIFDTVPTGPAEKTVKTATQKTSTPPDVSLRRVPPAATASHELPPSYASVANGKATVATSKASVESTPPAPKPVEVSTPAPKPVEVSTPASFSLLEFQEKIQEMNAWVNANAGWTREMYLSTKLQKGACSEPSRINPADLMIYSTILAHIDPTGKIIGGVLTTLKM